MKEVLTNKILTGLPDAEFVRLMPSLEPVALVGGEYLAEAGESSQYVYFPENCIISSHADMQDGKSVEVGMIGLEGVAGLPSFPGSRPSPHSLSVSIGGSALRVKRQEFVGEFERAKGLQQSILAYTGEYLAQVSQRSACAILHRLEQRLAVWLLLLHDRLHADTIELTQERMAQHLGVRRAGVTEIAGALQQRGAVSYTRGSLRVVDRRALETTACECYGALHAASRKNTYI